MDFEEWEPIYERILQDFGFDRGKDVRARDVLAGYVEPFDLDRLPFEDKTVAIAGGSQTLAEELDVVSEADAVVAASTAADVFLEAEIGMDLVVTDLDKTPETAIALNHDGVPVAVHAHGDNINDLRQYLPGFEVKNVLGTTQTAPAYEVKNVGGFTDGDRGAFLADHLGARRLVFPGWDFEDRSVSRAKRRKLAWAERLLLLLERRREETFEILDGRRNRIRSL